MGTAEFLENFTEKIRGTPGHSRRASLNAKNQITINKEFVN